MRRSAPRSVNGDGDRCWWCHCRIDEDDPYRGDAPELGLPAGCGVVVCTPACPARPPGVRVWRRVRGLAVAP